MAAHYWGRTPSEFHALPLDEQEWMEASYVAAVEPRTVQERKRDAVLLGAPPRRPTRPAG